MTERIHPECTSECTHRQVPALGGRIVQRHVDKGGRQESETILRSKFPGHRLDYLGISAEHPMHTWRLGGKKWQPLPSVSRTEGKQGKREITCLHRPDVWTGTGQVSPADFSRPAEPGPEPFPAPSLTSDTPAGLISAPASALLGHALALGWDGVVTQAKGHVPHATHGRPSAEAKLSEAVRLARGSRRAVAVRMGGSWASLWTWSPDQFFTRHATLEAFKEALR